MMILELLLELKLKPKFVGSKGVNEILHQSGAAAMVQINIIKLKKYEVIFYLATAIIAGAPLVITQLMAAGSISIGISVSAAILMLFGFLQIIDAIGVLRRKTGHQHEEDKRIKEQKKVDNSTSLSFISMLIGSTSLIISLLILTSVLEVTIGTYMLAAVALAQLIYSISFSIDKSSSQQKLLEIAAREGIKDWKKYIYDNATTPGKYLFKQIFTHALMPENIKNIYKKSSMSFDRFLIPYIEEIAYYVIYCLGITPKEQREGLIVEFKNVIISECNKFKKLISGENWESPKERYDIAYGSYMDPIWLELHAKDTPSIRQMFKNKEYTPAASAFEARKHTLRSSIMKAIDNVMHTRCQISGEHYIAFTDWINDSISSDLAIMRSKEGEIRIAPSHLLFSPSISMESSSRYIESSQTK